MGRIKRKRRHSFRHPVREMSLKKFFVYLSILCLVVALVVYITAGMSLAEWQSEQYQYFTITDKGEVIHLDGSPLTAQDRLNSAIYDILMLLLPFLIFITAIVIAATVFYHCKLKRPIEQLKMSAENIARNDLDFTIAPINYDEMAPLIEAFEKMRSELEQNNKSMWRMMEERKRLNAAFAHDLRTPITVLKGYTDLLRDYVPQGKISEEKLLSTVDYMSASVQRLQLYVDSMSRVQKLEDIELHLSPQSLAGLSEKLRHTLAMAAQQAGSHGVLLLGKSEYDMVSVDEKIILEVADNLIANAVRYARDKVCVELTCGEGFLALAVKDDGRGFSGEELQMATRAFYKEKGQENSDHLGLGLNICRLLCEKHGGGLTLDNGALGGAVVTAVFSIKVDKK